MAAQQRTRRDWGAEIARVTDDLEAARQTVEGGFAWVNGCLVAQVGINDRTGRALEAHDHELRAHDTALRRQAGQIDQLGGAVAGTMNMVSDHEQRLGVLERLRDRFAMPAFGWVAVILLAAGFWWLFNKAAHWLATPPKMQDGTIVVWSQLEGGKLALINAAIALAALGLSYGIVSLVVSARRRETPRARSNNQPQNEAGGRPQLTVVPGGEEPTRQLPPAASG